MSRRINLIKSIRESVSRSADTASFSVDGETLFVKRIDGGHYVSGFSAADLDGFNNFQINHISQVRHQPYYSDLRAWLLGSGEIQDKNYSVAQEEREKGFDFFGVIKAPMGIPTKKFRPAVWQGAQGSACARNEKGEKKCFGKNFKAALDYSEAEGRELRIFEFGDRAFSWYTGDLDSIGFAGHFEGIPKGSKVLWAKRGPMTEAVTTADALKFVGKQILYWHGKGERRVRKDVVDRVQDGLLYLKTHPVPLRLDDMAGSPWDIGTEKKWALAESNSASPLTEAVKDVKFLGLVDAKRALPNKQYRPAIWETMLGAVKARNDLGETKVFNHGWDAAVDFSGALDSGREPRVHLFDNSAYKALTGKKDAYYFKREHDGIAKGKNVLWIKKSSGKKTESAEGKKLDKEIESQDIELEPSEKQKESGVYKKGKTTLHGMNISIENPKGSIRSGVSKEGKEWSQKMKHHYGYIKGTVGKDKDHIDVFLGNDPESEKVFVVNQLNESGDFDEHKVMVGFKGSASAEKGYLANYEKGWSGLGSIHECSVSEFKEWLKNGNTKKPFEPAEKVTESTSLKERARESLYHITSIVSLIRILKSDVMQAPNGVSFTRARDGWKYIKGLAGNQAVIEIDQELLRNNYKVVPYQAYGYEDEMEEYVKGKDIENATKYIKAIRLLHPENWMLTRKDRYDINRVLGRDLEDEINSSDIKNWLEKEGVSTTIVSGKTEARNSTPRDHPSNIRALNNWLHEHGVPAGIELVRGRGYFYFVGDSDSQVSSWPKSGVGVNHLSHLSYSRWLKEFEQLRDEFFETNLTYSNDEEVAKVKKYYRLTESTLTGERGKSFKYVNKDGSARFDIYPTDKEWDVVVKENGKDEYVCSQKIGKPFTSKRESLNWIRNKFGLVKTDTEARHAN